MSPPLSPTTVATSVATPITVNATTTVTTTLATRWKCVMKGDVEINTQKIVPENSKLEDLDGDVRGKFSAL